MTLKERNEVLEECAKIAETFNYGIEGRLPKGWVGCRRLIAQAIRDGKTEERATMRPKTANRRPSAFLLILEAIHKSGLALLPIPGLHVVTSQQGIRFAKTSLAVGKSLPAPLLRCANQGNSPKPATRPLKVHNPKGGL